ncbi:MULTISPECIES: SDR family oxidoreductase [unclassified Ruegeria]|uniref:SDR family NAD(P)-dependent oxidoreductase n=1 Tax=unclassified Ruegeria TaxID=2625375 RepID=UPI001ADA9F8E|nr:MULTISPECIES: SDR family oxidoreductase [unclassified Ruegeria]MBO9412354.1 SDR family oxidoreductase [Ruegeria sp. R8_1]MBO9416408.1 SDR family oxidoreductase [Ruegeria sp. R8_2]
MIQPDFALDNKTILITGAARGLGAAMAGLTRSLADGICANAIAPGYVLTEMNRKILNDQYFVRRIENRTPAARWAEPAEIAAPVAFLLSGAASYINGQVLAIDGGMNAFLQTNEG